MKKTPQRSTKASDKQNSPSALKYKQRNGLYGRLIKDERKKEILQEMLDFGRDKANNALTFRDLYEEAGIHETTFYDWINQFPEFKPEFEEMKQTLANRKYVWSAFNKINPFVVRGPYGDYEHKELIPRYKEYRDELHERAKDLEAYKAKLKQDLLEEVREVIIKQQYIPKKEEHGQDSGSNTTL